MIGAINWATAPSWARFVACDKDGDMYWYENKPILIGEVWYNDPTIGGRVARVYNPRESWQTCIERPTTEEI